VGGGGGGSGAAAIRPLINNSGAALGRDPDRYDPLGRSL